MKDRLATLQRRRARVLRIERGAEFAMIHGDSSHETYVMFERAFRLRHRIEAQSNFNKTMGRS